MAPSTNKPGKQGSVAVIQKVRGSVNHVASLFEDVEKVPSWHPALHSLVRSKKRGVGVGSTQEFKARIRGREAAGTFEATVWEPGKLYAWKGTEAVSGVSYEVLYALTPLGDVATEVKATLSYEIPDDIAPLVLIEGSDELARRTLEEILRQLDLEASSLVKR